MNKYRKIMEVMATTPTVGAVGQLAAKRRTERGTGPMSKRRLAPTAQAGTVRTPGEKAALGLERRQERSRGTGFGATTIAGRRSQAQHGIAAGTEMNWKDKLFETILELKGDDPEGEEAWKGLWSQQATAGRRLLPRRPKRAPQTTAGATRSPSGQKRSKRTKKADNDADKKRAKDTARKLTSLMAARRARRQARVSQ